MDLGESPYFALFHHLSLSLSFIMRKCYRSMSGSRITELLAQQWSISFSSPTALTLTMNISWLLWQWLEQMPIISTRVNENSVLINRGNVINQMPYETGYPKCRTFGMSDSAKYPGLCKPYGVETSAGNDYAELNYNSINSPPSPPSYYTYKTLNGEYDGKVDKSFGLVSNNDNGPTSSRSRVQIYNTNPSGNSAAYRQDTIAPSQTLQRQKQAQFYNNNQQNYRTASTSTTKSPARQQQQYQLSPLQRNPSIVSQQQVLQQQPTQRKRTFDKNDPHRNQMEMAFKTYRWDLLFKKNHLWATNTRELLTAVQGWKQNCVNGKNEKFW